MLMYLAKFKNGQRYYTYSVLSAVNNNDHYTLSSGLCVVYKPKGMSSNDAVQKVRFNLQNEIRKKYNFNSKVKIKVGHGGTLDPLAEGVLVLGIGDGTKLMSGYLSGSKGYLACGLLGTEMDSQDSTGKVIKIVDCSNIQHTDLTAVLHEFKGDLLQMPPMFSALKKDGQRLYDLARSGVTVERQERAVQVCGLDLVKSNISNPFPVELPHFCLNVECGGGFYVRTLISDLAKRVGGVAHMTSLLRTKQGIFTLEDALPIDRWNYTEIKLHIEKCSAKAGIDVGSLRPAWSSSPS